MKLLKKAIEAKLPKLYSTDNTPAEAKRLVLKFFATGRGTWFVAEGERQADGDVRFFGYVVSALGPDCDEWGYFHLSELEAVRGQFGLRVERDRWFKPTVFADLQEERMIAERSLAGVR